MTFERSKDWQAIKTIVTHARVYPHITDDFSPARDKWEPLTNGAVEYILVRDKDEVLGLWAFEVGSVCWRVHTCLLPCAWGKRGIEAAEQMAQWIWTNTPCLRIITEVPSYNTLAFRFATSAGMERYGVNPQSYMKNGKLWDVSLLGISKPKE